MKIKNLFFLLSILLPVANSANGSVVKIGGTVRSELNTPIQNCVVTINGITEVCGKTGQFFITLSGDRLYRTKVEAKGFYPSFQTFSHYELVKLDESRNPNQLRLPDFSLVKRKSNRVLFAFGGDTMMGRRYAKPHFNEPVLIRQNSRREDTKALVQYVKPYLELADFASLNLETPISEKEPRERSPKFVALYSPPETVDALLWAGVDYVSLGNNHIYDYLRSGMISTLEQLNKKGLPYSGGGMNETEALRPYYAQLSGNRYALFGFVGWEGRYTPKQVADPYQGGAAFGNEKNMVKVVSEESKKGNPTIVQFHGSREYGDEPTPHKESRLKTAIDHGADLVVAHHPHVTQGFEIYKGKLIAYSIGNFLFDQYFPSTQYTFILYVWMDGDQFHRAELVPIYLKGYVPTPATGIERSEISKRVRGLTLRRGLHFIHSGGHPVLKARKKSTATIEKEIIFNKSERVKALYHFPTPGVLKSVQSDSNRSRYRLGINQLNGSDFESYDLFSSHERNWLLKNAWLTQGTASSGINSIALTIRGSTPSVVGMKVFRRRFTGANPMTFKTKILNRGEPVKAKLLFQVRKNRDKLLDALNRNKREVLKEVTINPDNNWQDLEIDFVTPRLGYRSYRVLLEISPVINQENRQTVHLDDMELIEWQPHYTEPGKLPIDRSKLSFITHIGFEFPPKKKKTIKVGFIQ